MQKCNNIISEVPQEDDISSISQISNNPHSLQDEEEYVQPINKKGFFNLADDDEDDKSFDEDEYQDLKSKGIKIQQSKENKPPNVVPKQIKEKPQLQRPQSAIQPKKPILKNKSSVLIERKKSEVQDSPKKEQTLYIDYKPTYTISYGSFLQKSKQYDYKHKSFNTLVKKSDRVARYQQMNQTWNKTKFLKSNPNTNGGLKEGRKLNLEERIKSQKQQQRDEGIFYKYITKSELFIQ